MGQGSRLPAGAKSRQSKRQSGVHAVAWVGGGLIVAGLLWWGLWAGKEQGGRLPPELSHRVSEEEGVAPAPQDDSSDGSGNQQRPDEQLSGEQRPGGVSGKEAPASARDAFRAELQKRREAKDAHSLREFLGAAVMREDLPKEERAALFDEVDALNQRLVFSATPGPGFVTTEVGPGESYWTISRRLRKEQGLRVTHGLLQAINRIPPHRLRSGQRLKVPTGQLSMIVDKSDFTLYVLLDGCYVRRFDVGLGREGLTPEGSFTIAGKTARPTWRDPNSGRLYEYGEPGHLIGSHWLGLNQDGAPTGYGLHGTIDPDSIGKAVSDGCVRLHNADVALLFDLAPEGCPAVVRF